MDGEVEPIVLRNKRGRTGPPSESRPGLDADCPASYYFPPLKISQSCDEVPMNKSIGSDNHALVREAIKAWRASVGSAGGPPCSAPIIRLFAGQMMPQTLSNISTPYAPPTPIDIVLLLALPPIMAGKNFVRPNVTTATRISMTMANTRPSLISAGTFLMIRNSIRNNTIGYVSHSISSTQTLRCAPALFALLTSAPRMYIA